MMILDYSFRPFHSLAVQPSLGAFASKRTSAFLIHVQDEETGRKLLWPTLLLWQQLKQQISHRRCPSWPKTRVGSWWRSRSRCRCTGSLDCSRLPSWGSNAGRLRVHSRRRPLAAVTSQAVLLLQTWTIIRDGTDDGAGAEADGNTRCSC